MIVNAIASFVFATVIACSDPGLKVCDTYDLPTVNTQDGSSMSFGECLGVGGQIALMEWKREHRDLHVKTGPRCSFSNDPHFLDKLHNQTGKAT